MKKSYLMLGLVAAALSSCSNDDPVSVNPNENQLPGTENLVPITLSMSTTSADVEVGTRGTGTVGDINGGSGTWKYEDIYLLMTSSDTLCLEEADIDKDAEGNKLETGWGFTSVKGVGPFLKHQFDGSFWARPTNQSTNNDNTSPLVYTLNYKLDKNEWWYGAGIDKFYPMKGASDFSAFYIDDALSTEEGQFSWLKAEGRINDHNFPTITKDAENKAMTVKFEIDGSQDLMAGYAALPADGLASAAYDNGFSAQSARDNQIPQVTMNHLLTRFTFDVKKGDENFEDVTLNSIKVKSLNKGTLTVAAEDETKIGSIVWEGKDDDGKTIPASLVSLSLKKQNTVYKTNATNNCVDGADAQIKVDLDGDPLTTDQFDVYYTKEQGLYYIDNVDVKTELTEDQINTLTTLQQYTAYIVDINDVCQDADGNDITIAVENDDPATPEVVETVNKFVYWEVPTGLYYFNDNDVKTPLTAEQIATITTLEDYDAYVVNANGICQTDASANIQINIEGNNYDVYWSKKDGLYYILPTDTEIPVPAGCTFSPALVEVALTAETGKPNLLDFTDLPLSTLGLGIDGTKPVGEAMFVSPGETKYQMDVEMTYLVRDVLSPAPDGYTGEALTEKITLPLTLKLDGNAAFQAGYSYKVTITIYGLKEVIADVELVQWEDGGNINVGQDDDDPRVTP